MIVSRRTSSLICCIFVLIGMTFCRRGQGGRVAQVVSVVIAQDGNNNCYQYLQTDPGKTPVTQIHLQEGDSITWYEEKGLSLTIDFEPSTGITSTGSPFIDAATRKRQFQLSAAAGQALPSGSSKLTLWEELWGLSDHSYYLDVKVNDATCYTAPNKPTPDNAIGVHVDP